MPCESNAFVMAGVISNCFTVSTVINLGSKGALHPVRYDEPSGVGIKEGLCPSGEVP